MGYTVELEECDLTCKSEIDAFAAAEIVAADPSNRLEVSAISQSIPPDAHNWVLVVDDFRGDHWRDNDARKLWLAIAPHLSDGATLELQGEDFVRWRIRWEGGRVYEEYIKEVIWAINEEITDPDADT